MIFNILLYFFYPFLVGVVNILPIVDQTSGFATAVENMSPYLSTLSQVLPVATILAVITFAAVFEGAYMIYKVAYWLIKKIPTIS